MYDPKNDMGTNIKKGNTPSNTHTKAIVLIEIGVTKPD